MLFPMQHLLRLPPSLRRQVLTNASFLISPLEIPSRTSRINVKRSYAQVKPVPKPSRRKPAPMGKQEPPPAPARRPAATGTNSPYADRLCHNSDIVLLYNSPRHTTYQFASYICGTLFFVGAVNSALNVKDKPSSNAADKDAKPLKTPWPVRISTGAGALVFAVIGTVFILGPTKIIRRIWLVKKQYQQPAGPGALYSLKVETKSGLPFRSGRTIESDIANFSIDRDVRAQQSLRWHSVPLTSSAAFTSHFRTNPTPPPLGILSRLRAINGSIMNAWPAVKRDVRRMFLREGFVYVYIVGEDGQWKLDLRGAEVLDGGRPLEKLMQTDAHMAKGLVPWLQRIASAVGLSRA